MKSSTAKGFLVATGLCTALSTSAKCGGVDYSWGADALALMHDYVVTMMLYVLFLRFGVIQEHTKPNARTFTMPYK